jgi:hypothetical protein
MKPISQRRFSPNVCKKINRALRLLMSAVDEDKRLISWVWMDLNAKPIGFQEILATLTMASTGRWDERLKGFTEDDLLALLAKTSELIGKNLNNLDPRLAFPPHSDN